MKWWVCELVLVVFEKENKSVLILTDRLSVILYYTRPAAAIIKLWALYIQEKIYINNKKDLLQNKTGWLLLLYVLQRDRAQPWVMQQCNFKFFLLHKERKSCLLTSLHHVEVNSKGKAKTAALLLSTAEGFPRMHTPLHLGWNVRDARVVVLSPTGSRQFSQILLQFRLRPL